MALSTRATAVPSWRSLVTSVAFGYLLAVMTFLAISGSKSTSSPSSSHRLLLVEDLLMIDESESEEEEEEESLDEVNAVLDFALC